MAYHSNNPTAGNYSTVWNQHTNGAGMGTDVGAPGINAANGAYADEFNSQFQQHLPLFDSHQTNGYTASAVVANPAVANTFIS